MKTPIIYVNNTRHDMRMFHSVLVSCVKNRAPLPEELADLFTWKIIEVDGEPRGILGDA